MLSYKMTAYDKREKKRSLVTLLHKNSTNTYQSKIYFCCSVLLFQMLIVALGTFICNKQDEINSC